MAAVIFQYDLPPVSREYSTRREILNSGFAWCVSACIYIYIYVITTGLIIPGIVLGVNNCRRGRKSSLGARKTSRAQTLAPVHPRTVAIPSGWIPARSDIILVWSRGQSLRGRSRAAATMGRGRLFFGEGVGGWGWGGGSSSLSSPSSYARKRSQKTNERVRY